MNSTEASLLLLCPLCLGHPKEPLYIRCRHVICAQCVQHEFQKKNCVECPVCKTKEDTYRQQFPADHLYSVSMRNIGRTENNSDSSLSSLVCRTHRRNVNTFCTTCSLPTCAVCETENHVGHEIVSPANTAQHRISEMLERLQKFDCYKKENSSLMFKVKDIYKQQKSANQCAIQEVERHAEFLQRKIEQKKNELVDFLKEDWKNREEYLKKRLISLEEIDQTLELQIPNVNTWSDPYNVLTINYDSVKTAISSYDRRIQENTDAIKKHSLKPVFEKNNFDISSIGNIKAKKVTPAKEPVVEDSSIKFNILHSLRLAWQDDGNSFGGAAELVNPTGILFMPNGDLLVANTDRHCIDRYEAKTGKARYTVCSSVDEQIAGREFDQHKNIMHEQSDRNVFIPNCLAYINGRVAFTDDRSSTVHFLDPDNQYKHVSSLDHRFFNTYLNQRGQVVNTFGLSALSGKAQLAVTDPSQARLYIVDVERGKVVSDSHVSNTATVLTYPTFVHFDKHSGRLLVTDDLNKSNSVGPSPSVIRTFDPRQKCRLISTLCAERSVHPNSASVEFSGLQGAGAVITDSQGNLIIANNIPGCNAISAFDSGGRFIKDLPLITKDRLKKKWLTFPKGLALDEEHNLLALTDQEGYGCVKMFQTV